MGQNYVKFGTFYDQLYELQHQEVTKVFDYFSVQLFRMQSNKKQYLRLFPQKQTAFKGITPKIF